MTDEKIYAEAEARLSGQQWIVDSCPYCGKRHVHGAGGDTGDPLKFLGHRNSILPS